MEQSKKTFTLETAIAQSLWSADPSAHSSGLEALGLQDFIQGVHLTQGLINNYSEQAAIERLAKVEDACHALKDSLLAEHNVLMNLQASAPDKNGSNNKDRLRPINSMSYACEFLHPLADLACDCLIQFDEFMLAAIIACEQKLIENKQLREYQNIYATRFRWIFQLVHANT